MGLADPLGSGGLPAPFTIAAAMLERGFLRSATGGSEIWGGAEACRYAQECLPMAAHKSDSGLPTLCLRSSHRDGGEGSCPKTVDVQRCFDGRAKAGN